MQPPFDPYAAQRALEEWAKTRNYTFNVSPDASWYTGWQPFIFARFARLGRELRGTFDGVGVALIEAFEGDAFKQASGEDRYVLGFVTSAEVRYRAAVRSKQGAGDLTDFGRSLGALLGGAPQPGAVLGDPAFEQAFEVKAPSRDEGNAALPIGLRRLLITTPFRGSLELRPGGIIVQLYGLTGFDPARLDPATTLLGQIYRAAIGQ